MKNKRIWTRMISAVITMAMFLTAVPSAAADEEFVIEGGVLIEYNGSGGNVVIPDGVTIIGEDAFRDCTTLVSVEIPDSVTSIGNNAFSRCTSLTEIEIPDSVTIIGAGAFHFCSALESIYLGSGVEVNWTSGGMSSYSIIERLKEINVSPENNFYSSIDGVLFNKAATTLIQYPMGKKSDSYKIPNGVKNIASVAFAECTELVEVIIPDSITNIGDIAFGRSSVSSLTFQSETPPTFGLFVFQNAKNLEKIYVPGGAEEAYENALRNYGDFTIEKSGEISGDWEYKLTVDGNGVIITKYNGNAAEVTVPDTIDDKSVVEIGDGVFENLSSITVVEILNGVTAIGSSVFRGCKNLATVSIPDSVTSIGKHAFNNTAWLGGQSPSDGVVYAGKVAYIYQNGHLPAYTKLHDGTKGIAGGAFAGCIELITIEIPESVVNVGKEALSGCINLNYAVFRGETPPTILGSDIFNGANDTVTIYVPPEATAAYEAYKDTRLGGYNIVEFCEICNDIPCSCEIFVDGDWEYKPTADGEGVIITGYKGDDTIVTVPVTIGNKSVVEIGNGAFEGSSITSVTIPVGVTAIGDNAFKDCIHLMAVVVPNSVLTIGDSAFRNCTFPFLTIPIPNSVVSIGEYAFAGCQSSLQAQIFDTLTESVTTIGRYAFADTMWLSNQSPSDGVVYAGKVAYVYKGDMPADTNITLRGDIKGIAGGAFADCDGLISVTFEGETPPVFGLGVFENCDNLKTIYVPRGTKNVYKQEPQLSGYNIIDGTESNDDWEYELTEDGEGVIITGYKGDDTIVTVPDTIDGNGVVKIGNGAFEGLSNITSVTIPVGVTAIGNNAFKDCIHLMAVVVPNSVLTIGNNAFRNCTSPFLTVQIPNGVVSIGEYAFAGCQSPLQTQIFNTLTESVTSIGRYAFADTNWLSGKPNGVVYAGKVAYVYKGDMPTDTTITLNADTKGIAGGAFADCTGLIKVEIPEGIVNVGKEAFSGCTNLDYAVFRDITPPAVGSDVFGEENDSVTIYVPPGAKAAYQGTRLGDYNIVEFCEICNEIPCICEGDVICPVCGGDLETDSKCFEISAFDVLLKYKGKPNGQKVIIPNRVRKITDNAFDDCTGLTAIMISSGVTEIISYKDSSKVGYWLFDGCVNLTEIDVSSANTAYSSIDGVLFNKEQTTLVLFPKGREGDYTLPADVKSIGDYAFLNCAKVESVTIPSGVTGIGEGAFYNCLNLTSITIPESVTSIGNEAFQDCRNLEEITLPSNITKIGNFTFRGCSSLTEITIPDKVTNIGDNAFALCSGLSVVEIPRTVTSIGDSAFYECKNLTAINVNTGNTSYYSEDGVLFDRYLTKLIQYPGGKDGINYVIPAEVATIESGAFSYAANLTSVTFQSTKPPKFGSAVFQNAGNLEIIYVPRGTKAEYEKEPQLNVYTIVEPPAPPPCPVCNGDLETDTKCFEINALGVLTKYKGEPKGQKVILPSRVTSIGLNVFSGCTGMTSIEMPNGIKNIERGAFSGCTGMTTLIIPDSVTSIDERAFENCTNLKSVKIPGGVKKIESYLFQGCKNLNGIILSNGVVEIGVFAFNKCEKLEYIDLPDSVTKIGDCAFQNCTGLKRVDIPASVDRIGEGDRMSFGHCTSLIAINVDPKNAEYYSTDGVLFGKFEDKKETHVLIQYPAGKTGDIYTIPSNTVKIKPYAFEDCQVVKTVIIPSSVKSMESYSFSNCTSMMSVTIPTTIVSIEKFTFESCENLTEVTIPSSVTSIGGLAFYGCKSLTSVTIPDSVKNLGENTFAYCESLPRIKIPGGITTIPYGTFSNCSSLTEITIPNNITSISRFAFQYCKGLTSVKISDGVTSVGEKAFRDCDSLTSVIIPAGVTEIGDYAFGYKTISKPGELDSYEKKAGFVIFGVIDTQAQRYAVENGFPFFTIGSVRLGLLTEESIEKGFPTIFDALEILKYLVKMEGVIIINEAGSVDAAMLNAGTISEQGTTAGEPTIFCALEILKFLVDMDGVLKPLYPKN